MDKQLEQRFPKHVKRIDIIKKLKVAAYRSNDESLYKDLGAPIVEINSNNY